jgi:hypothetical protein
MVANQQQAYLVGVMPNRWIIARQDAELGTLHVHFPRQGYTQIVFTINLLAIAR